MKLLQEPSPIIAEVTVVSIFLQHSHSTEVVLSTQLNRNQCRGSMPAWLVGWVGLGWWRGVGRRTWSLFLLSLPPPAPQTEGRRKLSVLECSKFSFSSNSPAGREFFDVLLFLTVALRLQRKKNGAVVFFVCFCFVCVFVISNPKREIVFLFLMKEIYSSFFFLQKWKIKNWANRAGCTDVHRPPENKPVPLSLSLCLFTRKHPLTLEPVRATDTFRYKEKNRSIKVIIKIIIYYYY